MAVSPRNRESGSHSRANALANGPAVALRFDGDDGHSVGAIVAIGSRRATTAEVVSANARGTRFENPRACEWRGGSAEAPRDALGI